MSKISLIQYYRKHTSEILANFSAIAQITPDALVGYATNQQRIAKILIIVVEVIATRARLSDLAN